jgi:hypothetical protein
MLSEILIEVVTYRQLPAPDSAEPGARMSFRFPTRDHSDVCINFNRTFNFHRLLRPPRPIRHICISSPISSVVNACIDARDITLKAARWAMIKGIFHINANCSNFERSLEL